ncbi:MAG: hypothetical protein ACE5GW_13300 [Planctomycetota bacterium]
MTTDSRSEIISVLREFVHGAISTEDLLRYVRRKELFYLDELLDQLQLRTPDYAAIALTDEAFLQRLDLFLDGEVPFREFAAWAFQLYRIYASSEYQTSDLYSRGIENGLLLLSLILDLNFTECGRRARRLVRLIHDAIRRRHPIPNEMILRKIYSGKRCLHLVMRAMGESTERPWREHQWADVALLGRPLAPGMSPPEEECWFVPLSLCTQEFWLEGGADGPWGHPENDKMPQVKESFPQLALSDGSPQYYVDPDGLAEVVLDSEEIGEEELEIAVRLFCLRNRARRCFLNGRLSYPTKEER